MFNGKNTLVVFGDSNVWGAEMPNCPEMQRDFKSIVYNPNNIKIWPHHIRRSFSGVLAERHNMQILNLSIPGCSNDTIFRRINKFLQGYYPVDLNDCFVMVFWTSVERREFYSYYSEQFGADGQGRYFNYSPVWADLYKGGIKKKFNKIYSRFVFSEEFDITKTFNYIYSLNAILSYKGIDFVQGYSLYKDEISNLVIEHKLPNFISHECIDSIHAIPADLARQHFKTKTKPLAPNLYQFEGTHPTELGHLEIANRYEELLKQRQAT
jgi:hypothetical protein